jgi:hypothetical protein
MAPSLIDKKSPDRESRTARPANGLDPANQKETSQPEFRVVEFPSLFSQAFEQRNVANREIFFDMPRPQVGRSGAIRNCSQPTIRAQRYAAIRQTKGLTIVNPTAMLETKRSAKLFAGRERRAFQTQFPTSRIELRNRCHLGLRSAGSTWIAGTAMNSMAT